MKKTIASFLIAGVMLFGYTNVAFAQDTTAQTETTTDTAAQATAEEKPAATEAPAEAAAPVEDEGIHQAIKIKFIEGGVEWMAPVLICLILGLALAIERIITLNLSSTNTDKFIKEVEAAIDNGGVEEAIELCKNKRGPVASIYTQGLMRVSEGVDMVEKSVMSYGSVQMAALEKGLVWISLFISLGPMLGFLGTVVGMIQAFDAIQAAGDINPSLVAGGIKVALITTVGGLIVAIILQILYNLCVSMIDSIVSQMEDSSIALIDMVVRKKLTK